MTCLGDLITFDKLRAIVPRLPDAVVRLMLDLPPDGLIALADLLDRVQTPESVVEALSIRIAAVRSTRDQLTDEAYSKAIVKAITAKQH
jgi:hypothetical protein